MTTAITIPNNKRRRWKASFDYQVDYNDHFETPLVAYQDILPLLDGLTTNRTRENHVLYDPYYCDGRTERFLRQLGFQNVIHEKRDFYKDIRDNQVPPHDTLVTNPPYSDTHKEQCLEFCLRQLKKDNRPFFLLMPSYVAARNYYSRILGDSLEDVAYLLPATPYEYDHPEGTGHEISPFTSLWFCGIGKDKIQQVAANPKIFEDESKVGRGCPKFVTSLEALGTLGAIATEKRPNPRQRKKRRAHREGQNDEEKSTAAHSALEQQGTSKPAEGVVKMEKSKKKPGRHRDESGKRTKKRF